MNTAERIKMIRAERKISQEELAERVNVSRQTISKWENGLASPSGKNLAQLGRALDVPADTLINDDWMPPEVQVVEVPVPRPGRKRLLVLLTVLALAAGILIGGVLFWKQPEEVITESELESEVIDQNTITRIQLLPLE